MAISATSQVLHDGAKNVVMQFTGVSDGSGAEANVVKVDASELVPPPRSIKVNKITYDIAGGIVRLLWSSNNPAQFVELSGVNTIDYNMVGGMKNGGDDSANGDILLSTLGFEAGSSYSVTLEMQKKY